MNEKCLKTKPYACVTNIDNTVRKQKVAAMIPIPNNIHTWTLFKYAEHSIHWMRAQVTLYKNQLVTERGCLNSLLASLSHTAPGTHPHSSNFLDFLLNWLHTDLHRMSGWTGSRQQPSTIQCKSQSRAFSQEGSRWKVRLHFPTAPTAPGLRARGETAHARGCAQRCWKGGDGSGAGSSRAPRSCCFHGKLRREHGHLPLSTPTPPSDATSTRVLICST